MGDKCYVDRLEDGGNPVARRIHRFRSLAAVGFAPPDVIEDLTVFSRNLLQLLIRA